MRNIITRRNFLVVFVLLATMSLGSTRALRDEKCGCSTCHTTEVSNGCSGCHSAPREGHKSEKPSRGLDELNEHDEPKIPDPDEPSNDEEPGKQMKGLDEPEGPEEPNGRDDPEKAHQGK
jgi:hypothetical protein